jgi:hypothetical protein
MELSDPQKISECLFKIRLSKELPVLGLHAIIVPIYKINAQLLQNIGHELKHKSIFISENKGYEIKI